MTPGQSRVSDVKVPAEGPVNRFDIALAAVRHFKLSLDNQIGLVAILRLPEQHLEIFPPSFGDGHVPTVKLSDVFRHVEARRRPGGELRFSKISLSGESVK